MLHDVIVQVVYPSDFLSCIFLQLANNPPHWARCKVSLTCTSDRAAMGTTASSNAGDSRQSGQPLEAVMAATELATECEIAIDTCLELYQMEINILISLAW